MSVLLKEVLADMKKFTLIKVGHFPISRKLRPDGDLSGVISIKT